MKLLADSLSGLNHGEEELYQKCKKLENESFKLLPNVIFHRAEEGTNQIDLLIVSNKGIFVIEMKDFKGWIFGNENQKEWTQSLNKGHGLSKKFPFRNPIKQNDNHIKTIKMLLQERGYNLPIYNVVVFGNSCAFKNVVSSSDVVKLSEIETVFSKYREVEISIEEIDTIYSFLCSKNIFSQKTTEEHLKYIENIKNCGIEDSQPKSDKDTMSKIERDNIPYSYFDEWKNSSTNEAVAEHLVYVKKNNKVEDNKPKKKESRRLLFGKIFWNLLYDSYRYDRPKYRRKKAYRYKKRSVFVGQLFFLLIFSAYLLISCSSEMMKEVEREKVVQKRYANQLTKDSYINDSSKGFIKIGSSKDDVRKILGEPIEINETYKRWYYGKSYVEFNSRYEVQVINNTGSIKISMGEKEANAKPIKIGSTADDVIKLMGTPDSINNVYRRWYYGGSYVEFNSVYEVQAINNTESIKISMGEKKPNANPIKIGSKIDDVIKLMGTPDSINNVYRRWYYGGSYVEFNSVYEVQAINNTGSIKVSMGEKEASAKPIKIGSKIDDVIKLMGTPDSIINVYRRWYYGESYIEFNPLYRVKDVQNIGEIKIPFKK